MGGGSFDGVPFSKFEDIGKQTGVALLDVASLGQTYSARKAAEGQERMLQNAKDQQAQQLEALRKQGPAPTQELPSAAEISRNKKRRLEALRAGMAQTIITGPSGLATDVNYAPSGKQKLGA